MFASILYPITEHHRRTSYSCLSPRSFPLTVITRRLNYTLLHLRRVSASTKSTAIYWVQQTSGRMIQSRKDIVAPGVKYYISVFQHMKGACTPNGAVSPRYQIKLTVEFLNISFLYDTYEKEERLTMHTSCPLLYASKQFTI